MKISSSIILFLLLLGCSKSDQPITPITPAIDCSHNKFETTIGGSLFKAYNLFIGTNGCGIGKAPPCPFTVITASDGLLYDFSIEFLDYGPGTYHLGQLWAKRDSIHYYFGRAYFHMVVSSTLIEQYNTDLDYNGILTITEKDEIKHHMIGNFSFTAKNLLSGDTTSVTDGKFEGCYY